MRDEDRGNAGALLNPANFLSHFKAQARVEVGERLIQQEQARVLDQGAGDCDALLLTAGKLGRLAVHQHIHVNQFGDFVGALDALGLRHALRFQRETDVAHDRHVRIERVILEDEADAALFRRHGRHILIVKVNFAAADGQNTRKHVEQGAFAAAGRAEQRNQFAIFQSCAEFADGGNVSKTLCDMIENNAHRSYLPYKYKSMWLFSYG